MESAKQGVIAMSTLERRSSRAQFNLAKSNRSKNKGTADDISGLNPGKASEALADALCFLRTQWGWNGSKIAQILHLSPTTVNGWLRKGAVPVTGKHLSPDLEAVVHLLAVHRSLAAMFTEPFHQLQWLNTKHPDLKSAPYLKMAESIEGLIQVRRYLDYVRGRGA